MAFDLEPDAKGLFGVCVFNAETAEDEELQEEFGKFGHIANINKSKNLVFIRYQEREEAERCLEAFRNHTKFNVNPARRKNPGNKEQRYQSSVDRSPREETMDSKKLNQSASDVGRKFVPVSKDDELVSEEPLQEILAKGVVINNLFEHVQQSQVYELCSKVGVKPLKIDMQDFKKPFYRRIYYAIVHVETEAEQKSIIDGLDNLVLNGRKMLVTRLDDYPSVIKTPE